MRVAGRQFSVETALVLYCAWHARDLLAAWQHSGFDRCGWLAMVIWCAPLLFPGASPSGAARSAGTPAVTMGAGLLCSFTGTLGALNVLQHVGLAIIVAGRRPWSWAQTVWLCSALSWMPALGWFGSRFFSDHVLAVRLTLAAAGAGWLIYHTARQRRPYRWIPEKT
jgi:hypothetical protein